MGALPLIVQQRRLIMCEGRLPGNYWSPAGDLLVDQSEDQIAILTKIIEKLEQLEIQWLNLSEIAPDREPWSLLLEVLERKGSRYKLTKEGEVGLVEFAGKTWDEYLSGCSKGHRKQLRRAKRKADDLGELEFRSYFELSTEQVEHLMRAGFEVERKSWKGEQGTAIVQNPTAADFYIKQARTLATSQRLAIYFLYLNDEAIAWEYGWLGDDTYHSLKIGYDSLFAAISPGMLILGAIIQDAINTQRFTKIDGMGPMGEAFGRWCNNSYNISRLEVPVGGLGQSKFIVGQRLLKPLKSLGAST